MERQREQDEGKAEGGWDGKIIKLKRQRDKKKGGSKA